METFDVVIAGGGPAGLSAALVLGRACRSVLVCDLGRGANRAAPFSHGLVTRDGIAVDEFARLGRDDLRKYETVQFREDKVSTGQHLGRGMRLTLGSGQQVRCRKVLLATGITYELPNIENVASFWGKSAFICPYCHALEYRNQPIAVIAASERAYALASLIKSWTSDLVLCTQGPAKLEPHQRLLLEKNRIRVVEPRVVRLEGKDGQIEALRLEDGAGVPRRAAVFCLRQRRDGDLASSLGIVENDGVSLLPMGVTARPHVFVAGDFGDQHQPRFLVSALYSGAAVAERIHRELAEEDFQNALSMP